MIYSENINKICGLCVKAKPIKGMDTHMQCTKRNECVPISNEACAKFEYDIFKRNTRRRKKSAAKFNAEDFKL